MSELQANTYPRAHEELSIDSWPIGGARPHVRRDHGYVDSDRGWRPEQSQTRDPDVRIEEEEVEEMSIPEIYVGHKLSLIHI